MNSAQTIILFLSSILSIGLISCADSKNKQSPIPTTVPTIVHNTITTPGTVSSPIKTPTELSFATPQSTPCSPFCTETSWLATSLLSHKDYQLETWTTADAMNVLGILDAEWEQLNEQMDYWIYGMMAVNEKRLYTALVAQEAVWRFPDNAYNGTLNWQIAHDLAVAGDTRANDWIARLLEEELNQQNENKKPNVNILWENGFTGELIPAQNLFGDNQQSWILKVSKQYDHMPIMQSDGATFAMKRSNEGEISVLPVDNFWMSWHGVTYKVTAFDHTADQFPEIIIANTIQAGSGSSFSASELCIYQWDDNSWRPVLSNYPDEPCFQFQSVLGSWEYLSTGENSPDILDVVSFVNSDCYWNRHDYYTWKNNVYQLDSIHIEIPPELVDEYGSEMFCLEDVWEWGVEEEEFSAILILMESMLNNWSKIEENISQTWNSDAIGFNLAYKDYFSFQLGRFYALSGDAEQAQKILNAVVEFPHDVNDPHWPKVAQEYLSNLNDLQRAEQNLEESTASNSSNSYLVSETIWVGDIGKEAETALFSGEDPQEVISLLQNALSNPNLSCYDNPCAHIYYLMGLAYEVMGDEENAIANYWFLWDEFPESSHAIIVQNKLQSIR